VVSVNIWNTVFSQRKLPCVCDKMKYWHNLGILKMPQICGMSVSAEQLTMS
jgi:hypothetical protein